MTTPDTDPETDPAPRPDLPPSEGLEFTDMGDGIYAVSGIGTCTDTDVRIPVTYNGAPVMHISNNAFQNCSSLTSVVIPDSVAHIGYGVFRGCSGLTSINVVEGNPAYRRCGSLMSITLPDSVTSIGRYAFADCTSLTTITFTGTMEQWNAIEKGESWNSYTGNYTVHCTDGDITQS